MSDPACLLRPAQADPMQLHLQPICRTDNGRVTGYELLYRSTDPAERDTQSFINKLEGKGLIAVFDENVLQRGLAVAQRLAQLLPAADKPLDLHINLSGYSLSQADFTPIIRNAASALPRHGVKVAIEVTETATGKDTIAFAQNLAALRKTGFGIVLDDFPQGHNSTGRLLAYEGHIDGIKIDKSLIVKAAARQNFQPVQHIVALAHARGKSVVAEGVTGEPQLRLLHGIGVDFGQGYGLGRPMPAAELLQAIAIVRTEDGQLQTRPLDIAAKRTPVSKATATAFIEPRLP